MDNTNRGAIWPNRKKERDSQPDYTGRVDVEGKEFFVSAWKRKPDANPKAPSLSFSLKAVEEVQSEGMTQVKDAFDDDIPF